MSWKPTAVAAAILGLGVLPAFAQMRGGAGGHVTMARPAPTASRVASSPHITAAATPFVAHPRRHHVNVGTPLVTSPVVNSGFFPGATVAQEIFGFPTPGLGFDYVHWAAVNGNLDVRALIDPVTQLELAQALRLQGTGTGFFPGFYAPYGGAPIVMESPAGIPAATSDSAPQQPQPIYVVTPPPAAQAQTPVAEQAPLPDPGEFVLVQRDGRLLFAVAFTSSGGRLVYVTKDGLRRSVPLSQIDVDSTERMNEERGSSIQLPTA